MRASAWRGRGEGGFTMMELMISAAILGLLMAGLLGLLTASRDAYARGSSTIEAQQNARLAIERIAKEIREAGYHPRPPDTSPATCPPGPGSLYPTGEARTRRAGASTPSSRRPATALTLQYDWNGDGVITTVGKVNDPFNCPTGAACRGEQVTYSMSGTTLMRRKSASTRVPLPIATGISALTFTYLKDDNTTATAREDIRSVQIADHRDDGHHDGSDSPADPLSGASERTAG